MTGKKILGAAIGNCVHVAGIIHFLQLAENEGYETCFLGPAVSIDALFRKIMEWKPNIVSISYRLTPKNVESLLEEIDKRRKNISFPLIWEFGGTKPVAEIANKFGFFKFVSDGFDDINDSIAFLRGISKNTTSIEYENDLIGRIENSYPYPILRHHFGLPSLEDTIRGVAEIANSKVLDVISIGPDQNAQQYFFNQKEMKVEYDGAGGVPLRNESEFRRLKEASKCGNYPLMRCYSGTADVFKYAEMLKNTIDNAWAAIPLCWYNELDGRGTRKIEDSIKEAQKLISWHVQKGIPVEINEPHHWGLRDSHDVISVAMAFISAYNAKKLGVRHYISQYMFNTPNGLSFPMDIAKILAMNEMVESLQDNSFKVYRQTRAGLALFNADEDVAKGQLATSTFMQMILKPHIIHVVSFTEADHAACAKDVIESCKIVKGVIRHTLNENFGIDKQEDILKRKNELILEANILLEFINTKYHSSAEPLLDAEVIADSIKRGYIDAVHINKNKKFKGNLQTKYEKGKCVAYNPISRKVLTEYERLKILDENNTN